MKLKIRHRVPELQAQVERIPGLVREASRRAANTTARGGTQAVYAAMRGAFRNPVPYTLRSLRTVEAQPGAEPGAAVMVRGRPDAAGGAVPQQSYLRAQIQGGGRRWKRFEVALMKRGILPRGWYAIPGKGARLDAYGNMSAGQIVQLMSWLQLFATGRGERLAGRRLNTTGAKLAKVREGTANRFGVELVVSSPLQAYRKGGLPPGIYSRQVNRRTTRTAGPPSPLLPVIVFVKSASYRARLDFFGELQRHTAQQLPLEVDRATARIKAARLLKDVR